MGGGSPEPPPFFFGAAGKQRYRSVSQEDRVEGNAMSTTDQGLGPAANRGYRAYVLALLFLLVRPQGLFPKTRG